MKLVHETSVAWEYWWWIQFFYFFFAGVHVEENNKKSKIYVCARENERMFFLFLLYVFNNYENTLIIFCKVISCNIKLWREIYCAIKGVIKRERTRATMHLSKSVVLLVLLEILLAKIRIKTSDHVCWHDKTLFI